MYDELVKRLRAVADGGREEKCGGCPYEEDYPCCVDCLDKLHKQAADAIEELTALSRRQEVELVELTGELASKPRWIPVTERLPEEHVFVLIRQDDDRMMVAERVDGDWWYRYFAYDVDRWDENEQGKITHWMPLPEPPEEEN